MNKKILITFFASLIVSIFGYFVLVKNQTLAPQTQQVVFVSQEECEQKTGKPCSFQMCDDVPHGKTLEEVCGKDFKKGWMPVFSPPEFPKTQSFTIDGRKIIDVVLEVDAPFSTATLTIRENGSVSYVAKQSGRAEVQESGTVTADQLNILAKMAQEIDFLNMNGHPAKHDDPLDGSTYAISISILPQGDPRLADPGIHSVSCYEGNCERNFLKLKDKIIELWGKDILEVGI